jgi:hypothetical protein
MNKTTIILAIILSFQVVIGLGEYNFKIIEQLRNFWKKHFKAEASDNCKKTTGCPKRPHKCDSYCKAYYNATFGVCSYNYCLCFTIGNLFQNIF